MKEQILTVQRMQDYCEAIAAVQQAMNSYAPASLATGGMTPILGFSWSPAALVGMWICEQ